MSEDSSTWKMERYKLPADTDSNGPRLKLFLHDAGLWTWVTRPIEWLFRYYDNSDSLVLQQKCDYLHLKIYLEHLIFNIYTKMLLIEFKIKNNYIRLNKNILFLTFIYFIHTIN